MITCTLIQAPHLIKQIEGEPTFYRKVRPATAQVNHLYTLNDEACLLVNTRYEDGLIVNMIDSRVYKPISQNQLMQFLTKCYEQQLSFKVQLANDDDEDADYEFTNFVKMIETAKDVSIFESDEWNWYHQYLTTGIKKIVVTLSIDEHTYEVPFNTVGTIIVESIRKNKRSYAFNEENMEELIGVITKTYELLLGEFNGIEPIRIETFTEQPHPLANLMEITDILETQEADCLLAALQPYQKNPEFLSELRKLAKSYESKKIYV